MPRILSERVTSHMGGVDNTTAPDLLQGNELREIVNARSQLEGAMTKRGGTKRLNFVPAFSLYNIPNPNLSIGVPFTGIHYWEGPEGRQVVGAANGDLFWHNIGDVELVTINQINLDLSTENRTTFAVHYAGGERKLYFTDGDNLYSFDGMNVDTVDSPPTDGLRDLQTYHGRLFGTMGSRFIAFSVLHDPENWSVLDGAGQAAVETFDSEPVNSLAKVGSSLLLAKSDSISRFTGYDRNDVRIDTGTEGVSPSVGVVAPRTLIEVDNVVFFLSDRGPYLATESAVRYIGQPIENELLNWNADKVEDATAVHNKRRREVWLFVPSEGSDENDQCWVFDYEHAIWYGPWEFTFGVVDAVPFEREDGTESVALAGYDGFIRDGDVEDTPIKDDMVYDGTGGTPVEMSLKYRDFTWGDPDRLKIAPYTQSIQADLKTNGQLTVAWDTDQHSNELNISSKGSGIHAYRFRGAIRGRRVTLSLSEPSSEPSTIYTVHMKAALGRARV